MGAQDAFTRGANKTIGKFAEPKFKAGDYIVNVKFNTIHEIINVVLGEKDTDFSIFDTADHYNLRLVNHSNKRKPSFRDKDCHIVDRYWELTDKRTVELLYGKPKKDKNKQIIVGDIHAPFSDDDIPF